MTTASTKSKSAAPKRVESNKSLSLSKKPEPSHPKYSHMIIEAIKGCKDKKGISRAAISNYISATHFNGERQRPFLLAKSLKKALQVNVIAEKAPGRYVLHAKLEVKRIASKKKQPLEETSAKKDVQVKKITRIKRATPIKKLMPVKKVAPVKKGTPFKKGNAYEESNACQENRAENNRFTRASRRI